MISHLRRIIRALRIACAHVRVYAYQLRHLADGGATGDSDALVEEAARCARGEHRAAGESMPGSCADCGVNWSDLDEPETRVERIAARFEAADPKWHRLRDELKRRYPKDPRR